MAICALHLTFRDIKAFPKLGAKTPYYYLILLHTIRSQTVDVMPNGIELRLNACTNNVNMQNLDSCCFC